eukprot:560862-Hanusia_phi.AAC.1
MIQLAVTRSRRVPTRSQRRRARARRRSERVCRCESSWRGGRGGRGLLCLCQGATNSSLLNDGNAMLMVNPLTGCLPCGVKQTLGCEQRLTGVEVVPLVSCAAPVVVRGPVVGLRQVRSGQDT